MLTICLKCQKINNPPVQVCECGSELFTGSINMQPSRQSGKHSATAVTSEAPQFNRQNAPVESRNFSEQPLLSSASERELSPRQKKAIQRLMAEENANARKPANSVLKTKAKKLLGLVSFVVLIGAMLAFLGGFVNFAGIYSNERENEQTETSQLDVNPALNARNNSANNLAGKDVVQGEVTDVLSGDTIRVATKDNQEYLVKLEGIDAPELEQDFGPEARTNLFASVFGKTVQIVRRANGADGSVVGKVLLNGASVNLEQMMMGLAWHDKAIAVEPEDNNRYEYYETVARKNGYGLWAQTNPRAPWEYRNAVADQNAQQKTLIDPANDTPAIATTVAPKTKEILQETATNQAENQPTTEDSSVQAKTLVPSRTNPPLPPKVSVSVPTGYEHKTTLISRTATARCGDGTLSFSATRSGSCARHGGVAQWLGDSTQAPTKTDARPRKYSLGARGGCYFTNDNGKKVYVDRQLCAN